MKKIQHLAHRKSYFYSKPKLILTKDRFTKVGTTFNPYMT